jgi:LysR family transcriptional regulator, glycine cleavage system transcriptional activator
MNLNSLKIVESAARHQNFTRAGEEQFITASAVSQRVKGLEDQLRFKIFQRRKNAVSLTPEGELFVRKVREALDRIVAAGLEVRRREHEHMLKISVLPTFAMRWLLPRLNDFQDGHADTHLHLSTSYDETDFRQGDLDLEIRYGDGRFPGLYSEPLFREDLTPVCSIALFRRILGNRSFTDMDPRELSLFTLLHSDTCMSNWKSWLEHVGAPKVLDEARAMSFDSCMLSFQAANAGLGFAVANRAYVQSDIDEGRLVAPFRVEHPNRMGWHFVCPKGHLGSPKLEAFRSWLRKEAEKTQAMLDERKKQYDETWRPPLAAE